MRDIPIHLPTLAADLGISKKTLEAMVKKRGYSKVKRQLRRDWVRLCGDQPRLLAKQAGHAHPQQYTNSTAVALNREPEAVSEEDQRHMTKQADARRSVLMADDLAKSETRTRTKRLREAEARARRLEIDTRPFVLAIDAQIAELERACRR